MNRRLPDGTLPQSHLGSGTPGPRLTTSDYTGSETQSFFVLTAASNKKITEAMQESDLTKSNSLRIPWYSVFRIYNANATPGTWTNLYTLPKAKPVAHHEVQQLRIKVRGKAVSWGKPYPKCVPNVSHLTSGYVKIAIENGPFIVSFPMKNADFP